MSCPFVVEIAGLAANLLQFTILGLLSNLADVVVVGAAVSAAVFHHVAAVCTVIGGVAALVAVGADIGVAPGCCITIAAATAVI